MSSLQCNAHYDLTPACMAHCPIACFLCRGGSNLLLGTRLGQAASTDNPEAGPWMTLGMGGHVALTTCSYHALFHSILLYLQVTL